MVPEYTCIFALSGCIKNIDSHSILLKYRYKDPQSYAIAVLEERYDESFKYAGGSGNSDSMSGTKKFYVSCDSMPEAKIYVCMRVTKQAKNGLFITQDDYLDPSVVITDNYLMYKYQDDIYALLEDGISQKFSAYEIFFEPTNATPENPMSADTSLEEMLDDSETWISALVEVRGSELGSLEQAQKAVSTISDHGCSYAISFVAVEDNLCGTLSLEELQDCLRFENYVNYVILSQGRNGYTQADWIDRNHQ